MIIPLKVALKTIKTTAKLIVQNHDKRNTKEARKKERKTLKTIIIYNKNQHRHEKKFSVQGKAIHF